MFAYDCDAHAVPNAAVHPSLGPDTAPFRLLQRADLPDRWRAIPVDRLAVELPDTPWGRAYYAWAVSKLEDMEPGSGPAVMLVSMANFREPLCASTEAAACLRCLLDRGTPPPGHILQIVHEMH